MDDSLTVGGATGLQTAAVRSGANSRSAAVHDTAADTAKDARTTEAERPKTTGHFAIDPATRSVVFRIVSAIEGTVVAQFPNEIQLRVREYVAAADASAQVSRTEGKTA